MTTELPLPHVSPCKRGGMTLLTDEELFARIGVRLAFTGRDGGASAGPYSTLNLGSHVQDDDACVQENRNRLLAAVDAPEATLLVPNQVHGTEVAVVGSARGDQVAQVRERIAQGTDGIVVTCEDVAALLCFADCMPVIVVAPDGAFAVVHAGWRGVYGRIVPKAVGLLCEQAKARPSECNVYVGPYIHVECFEVGEDLATRFSNEFGSRCVSGADHVDLGLAMRVSLEECGVDPARIADAGACTVCESGRFFSYRAQGGVCGRHGAIAVRTS